MRHKKKGVTCLDDSDVRRTDHLPEPTNERTPLRGRERAPPGKRPHYCVELLALPRSETSYRGEHHAMRVRGRDPPRNGELEPLGHEPDGQPHRCVWIVGPNQIPSKRCRPFQRLDLASQPALLEQVVKCDGGLAGNSLQEFPSIVDSLPGGRDFQHAERGASTDERKE